MQSMTISYAKDISSASMDVVRHGRGDAHNHAMLVKAVVKRINDEGYEKVAEVEYDERKSVTINLENAYRLLQNGVVTDSWTLSPPDGLTPLVGPHRIGGQDYGHRSMSIGDLIEYGGETYVVAMVGFTKVT